VVLVSCLPVCTLGFGAALTHLLRVPVPGAAPAPVPAQSAVPVPRPREDAPRTRTRTAPKRRTPAAPVTDTDAEAAFMDELASGSVPSIRQIRARLHLGQDKAQQVQHHLRTLARTP
jgi:hypothetical protein